MMRTSLRTNKVFTNKGDKRTLGEILVDLGFCDFDDITTVVTKSRR